MTLMDRRLGLGIDGTASIFDTGINKFIDIRYVSIEYRLPEND